MEVNQVSKSDPAAAGGAPSSPVATPPMTLAEIRALAASGERAEARRQLRKLIEAAPTPANLSGAARLWESFEAAPLPGAATIRIALIGSGTLDPLGAQLRVATAGVGLHPYIYVGQFDQWAQDLLAPDSALYRFDPDVILVSIESTALFPRMSSEAFVPEAESKLEYDRGISSLLGGLLAAARHAPRATVVVSNFVVPNYAPFGIADLQMEVESQRARVEDLNRSLNERLRRDLPSVILFDLERVESRFGKARVRDLRRWYVASIPFSEEFSRFLALEYMRVIRPLKGLTRKCVVVDLDNTLWGGVVGEDGADGVKVGGAVAPGNAFLDLQIVLENLRRRGILLAICSKNNLADAMAALETHPGMLLRPASFAAMRINWDDKASNLVSLAKELNIGLDSLVFLDDNPAERGQVRERLPEVLIVELPRDPALYAATVEALDVFESLQLTDEDRRRSDQYYEQRQRAEFERVLTGKAAGGIDNVGSAAADGAADLHSYLFDLAITVRMELAAEASLSRVAQLINKTNQFNLTTRRYTEAEVREMAADTGAFGIYTIHVSDRFGDSGLTGVSIVSKNPQTWSIDSFLLSCRVLGRGIEQSLMRFLVLSAQNAGAKALRGIFIATAKNEPAGDFYARMGFAECSAPEAGSAGQMWELKISSEDALPALLVAYPDWVGVSPLER